MEMNAIRTFQKILKKKAGNTKSDFGFGVYLVLAYRAGIRKVTYGKPHLHALRPMPRWTTTWMRILLAAYKRSSCFSVFAFIPSYYLGLVVVTVEGVFGKP